MSSLIVLQIVIHFIIVEMYGIHMHFNNNELEF